MFGELLEPAMLGEQMFGIALWSLSNSSARKFLHLCEISHLCLLYAADNYLYSYIYILQIAR